MGLYLGENPVAITKISNDAYGWLGSDIKYVGKLYEWNDTLNNTTYSSWTPSTTAGSILNAQSDVASFTIPDRTLETYYVLTRWDMNFAYNSGTTMTSAPIRYTFIGLSYYYNYPTSSQYISGEYGSYSNVHFMSNYAAYYYNSSGTLTTSGNAYAPAYSTSGTSWSTSTSGNTVTVTLNKPAISARCSASYFSTDRAADVDTTNSTLKYRLDLFKGPKPGLYEQVKYRMITDVWNDNWNL